jgi:SAM-dependent methyltransferase
MSAEHPFISLQKIYDMAASADTDKGTLHSYLDVYAALFGGRRFAVRNVLEVGVNTGGSIVLWERFFPNARIFGLDVTLDRLRHTVDGSRTKLLVKDAYTPEVVAELSDTAFDIIIDDGPHTLESMLFAAANFPGLLREGGVFVIEDVQSPDWLPKIIEAVPEHLRAKAEVVDRRQVKKRYDDLMLVLRV